MRKAEIIRNTNETKIKLELEIDGEGNSNISTKCGFFDHMLTLFAKHSLFNIDLICDGDVEVDYHHTVEDVGIAIGEAIRLALGDKTGIERYGNTVLPMDEAVAMTACDIGGRAFLTFKNDLKGKAGDFDMELIEEFMRALCENAKINFYVNVLEGKNNHHIAESIFKSVARTLRRAVKVTSKVLPTTKGII